MIAKELNEQFAHAPGLFLLHPVASAIDQVESGPIFAEVFELTIIN